MTVGREVLALLLAPCLAIADEPIETCFVPGGPPSCTAVIVREIATARKTVRVLAYGFTSAPIEHALVEAHKRGVDVQVILDRSNLHQRYSGLSLMEREGVPTSIDSAHAISHNKVLCLDSSTVITGSFNLTTSAQAHNAENLVVIHDADVAAKYEQNWQRHREHAKEAQP